MIYLLAYPRSGSSYIRYSLGFLTESKPLQPHGHCEMDHLLSEHYKKDPFFVKFHHPTDGGISINKNENNKLVLVYRNPIENILSYMFSKEHMNKKGFTDEYIKNYINETIESNSMVFNIYYNQFLENILFYKNWDYEKEIFYYDNFLTNPSEELQKVQNVFKFTNSRLEEFIKNIDNHKNIVLNHKTKKSDPFSVNTKGKQLNKFTNMLTNENLFLIENKLKSDGIYGI